MLTSTILLLQYKGKLTPKTSMSREQLNLNLKEGLKSDLRELCEGVLTPSGQPISLAIAVTNWIEASKKAGYLLGVADLSITNVQPKAADIEAMIEKMVNKKVANLSSEVEELKKPVQV